MLLFFITYVRILPNGSYANAYGQFQEKYNARTNFVEFIGIRTSIEALNLIRRIPIHVGIESLFNCHRPINVNVMKSPQCSECICMALTCKTIVPTSQPYWEWVFENPHLDRRRIRQITSRL